jgi:putative sterol carrier protein
MMSNESTDIDNYVARFNSKFKAIPGVNASYKILVDKKPFSIIINGPNCNVSAGSIDKPDVEVTLGKDILEAIMSGRMTFQRAFMSGEMKMKGEFKILRSLDEVFLFME